jgi:hypothetical protein
MSEGARLRRRRRWRRAAKVAEIALRLGLAAAGGDLLDFGSEVAESPPDQPRAHGSSPAGVASSLLELRPEVDGHAGPG